MSTELKPIDFFSTPSQVRLEEGSLGDDHKLISLSGDGLLNQPIDLGRDNVLQVCGHVTIECACPVRCSSSVKLVGVGEDSVLVLKNTEFRQPCVGHLTHDGMSYGRWQFDGKMLHELTIDGLRVVCQSVNENFTIGTYGEETPPKIAICNDGSLEAPEMEGERVMLEPFTVASGSTKISDDPQYAVVYPDLPIPVSDKYKAVLEQARAEGYDLSCWDSVGLTGAKLDAVFKWLKKGVDLFELGIITRDWSVAHIKWAGSSYLVGMPADEILSCHEEFRGSSGADEMLWWDVRIIWVCTNRLEASLDQYAASVGESVEAIQAGPKLEMFLKKYFREHVADSEDSISRLDQKEKVFWWELINPFAFYYWEGLDSDLSRYYLAD